LNKEKAAFNAKRHLLRKDVDEFEQKYQKLFDEKHELIDKLDEIIHGKSHEIVFGIRPESIVRAEPDDKTAMKVKVRLSELLGDQYFVHFDYGGKDFLSKITADHLIETGVEMALKIVDAKIHVFDPLLGFTIL
jgi:ABC-type sugar transport system ATPase subunit